MTAPARLLAVRLHGFKSFAERTTVEFRAGISAVVGPNGSGKSNLADGLRWALGEQGRTLRIRKAEDVIWAGSDRRAAQGMADVAIVLDNVDGLLPVDYGTVEVGRRLYRSGENDYLLNRQRVRLRDIVDLLDTANLADNAFLFIGQGMVDQALSLRPEERRPLFEEVAGVRRHERRRRRSEEQLAESLANLARVEDVLAELRPQARRLAAQAAQQASRESAGAELVEALLLSGHARWHVAAARDAAAEADRRRTRDAAGRAMAELAAAEERVVELTGLLEARATDERGLRATQERDLALRTDAELRRERLVVESAAQRRDRDRLTAERESALAALEVDRAAFAEPRPARDVDLDARLPEAERALAEAEAELAGLRAADRARDEGLAALRRAEAAHAAEVETARRRLAEAEVRWRSETAAWEAAAGKVTVLERLTAETRTALEAATAAERAAIDDRERARGRSEAAEVAASATRDSAEGRAASAAVRRSRLEALRSRLVEEDSRGLARAARRVGGRPLDEGVVVDPAVRVAVGAALAHLAGAWVVARPAVASLGEERGVLVVDEGAPRTEAVDRPPPELARRFLELVVSRGGGPLASAVRRDRLGAASRLLARAAWLPDLATCLELQASLPPGWVLVPRDGGSVVGEQTVTLGTPESSMERRAQLDELTAEAERLEAAARGAAAELEAAAATATAARETLADARGKESSAVAERRRREDTERRAARDLEVGHRESEWHRSQVDRIAGDVAQFRQALAAPEARALQGATTVDAPTDGARGAGVSSSASSSAATGSAATGTAGIGAARNGAARNGAARNGAASALTAWEGRAADLRTRRDRLAQEAAAADAVRREADGRRSRAEAVIALREERLSAIGRDLDALGERARDTELLLEAVVREAAEGAAREAGARAAVDHVVAASAAARDQLAAAERASTRARERFRVADETAHAAERSSLEARLGLEGLREQLLADLAGMGEVATQRLGVADHADEADDEGRPLESALDELAADWAASPASTDPPGAARLTLLRRRFHELGAANPFAVDEHRALESRLEELESQRADLVVAIERTRRLIEELGTLIADQFQSTFRALEGAFDERFRQLFGGGYARLELTDPADLGSTGVEISARPPGKRRQPLAMLSGGERSLTAVALLLAMLQVRPVPFCVLDEVDAALDEANIDRFTGALRELADVTQFVVITHNRGTIHAADALYGVTLGDDSVSRVISLRLDGEAGTDPAPSKADPAPSTAGTALASPRRATG